MIVSRDFEHSNVPQPVFCPECGGEHYEDNRLDISLYREAEKEVPLLLFEGREDEALNILCAYHAVLIANKIRRRWRCECGALFNA